MGTASGIKSNRSCDSAHETGKITLTPDHLRTRPSSRSWGARVQASSRTLSRSSSANSAPDSAPPCCKSGVFCGKEGTGSSPLFSTFFVRGGLALRADDRRRVVFPRLIFSRVDWGQVAAHQSLAGSKPSKGGSALGGKRSRIFCRRARRPGMTRSWEVKRFFVCSRSATALRPSESW